MKEDLKLTEEQVRRFAKYIGEKRIVIADGSQSIRSSLSKAFLDMGAKSSCVHMASNFTEAVEKIRTVAPEIVVSDYSLEGRSGIELVSFQREVRPTASERLFVLVTGNSAESVVAEAAEEEVDSYILKPFTGTSIRYYLTRAGLAKSTPTPYQDKLQQGKQLLETSKFEEALALFNTALELDKTPTLACYYLGQTYERLELLDPSEQSYRKGLSYNELHYKCSIGLYELYLKRSKHKEAYSVLRKVSEHFPLSPQRLSKAIELAVKTGSFADISRYHDIFRKLDERRDELRKIVCAALIVAGKYYLMQGDSKTGVDLLQHASFSAGSATAPMREIVLLLINNNLPEQAATFLKRFAPETRKETNYLATELAVIDVTGKAEDVIVAGRKLLRAGVKDPLVHKIMIRREHEVGHEDEAETLLNQAIAQWPARAEEFKSSAGSRS